MNPMKLWTMTDVGLVRKDNQDAFATRQLESGFVLAYGPVELDCTFPALFQEAYDQLRDAAGAILFAPAGAKEEP